MYVCITYVCVCVCVYLFYFFDSQIGSFPFQCLPTLAYRSVLEKGVNGRSKGMKGAGGGKNNDGYDDSGDVDNGGDDDDDRNE